ncbi:MAG: UDP-N-acetylmuramoyl-L-alanyl-D-glutamate--2,6-diaminopimelate ligase [Oscillospiraceae bacterium]|jgi:UDP-N-acetylmuramoyl-L-alanyl-D-glutamate--2,6-diaminopimelate ligase|nr:UDP-N-acetylmuramoyl-L-alanyl-D-glutamate--2,6-diaminopimelate ligase [Oscillospiraceae bacterium]
MKLGELLSGITPAETNADSGLEIGGVCRDSRSVNRGDLFVAVRGFEADGHAHAGDAVRGGAVCVVCEERPKTDAPYILVENSRAALAVIAANFFGNPADRLKIVGVTGTKGKTTTAFLIKGIIEKLTGKPAGLIGTVANLIGDKPVVTESAAPTTPGAYELHSMFAEMTAAGCEYCVMEVSSHALALDRVYGVEFETGVFTNLAHEHLDFHNTMDGYADAKALLFGASRRAVVNLDDAFAPRMLAGARPGSALTYSLDKLECDVTAKRVRLMPDRVEFCALTIGTLQQIVLHIPGLFSVYNALAASTACVALGFSLADIADALSDCRGVIGRAEVVPTGRGFTVVIDYAHNPSSLEQIITTLRESAAGRVITLFGCGGDRDKTKRPEMGAIAAALSDLVIVTSDNPRTEEPDAIIADILAGMQSAKSPYRVIADRREAIAEALGAAEDGDTVLLAGKGHETYQIIGKTKYHFDEREVVADVLAKFEEAVNK